MGDTSVRLSWLGSKSIKSDYWIADNVRARETYRLLSLSKRKRVKDEIETYTSVRTFIALLVRR